MAQTRFSESFLMEKKFKYTLLGVGLNFKMSEKRDKVILFFLGAFTVVTFILDWIFESMNPTILDLPFDKLRDGGLVASLLYGVFWHLPKKIESLEKKLLGSLLPKYSQFRGELRKRLTKTSN